VLAAVGQRAVDAQGEFAPGRLEGAFGDELDEAIEIMCRPNWRLSSTSSGRRAIEPSSLRISQMTPLGCRPAREARSTAASVCPARWSTPPGRARSGKMCPGCTSASGLACGSARIAMVFARS
jgi:hypothetical protein